MFAHQTLVFGLLLWENPLNGRYIGSADAWDENGVPKANNSLIKLYCRHTRKRRDFSFRCSIFQLCPQDLSLDGKKRGSEFMNFGSLILGNPSNFEGSKNGFLQSFVTKCRILIFQLWHFPPIFVLLKLTCLVTVFERKLQVFKNSPKWSIFGIFKELLSTQNVNVTRFATQCWMRLFLWF